MRVCVYVYRVRVSFRACTVWFRLAHVNPPNREYKRGGGAVFYLVVIRDRSLN